MSAITKVITTASNASTQLPARWNGTARRYSRSLIPRTPSWCGTSQTRSTQTLAACPWFTTMNSTVPAGTTSFETLRAGTDLKFQIFDITTRDSDPSQISLVSEITGTPEKFLWAGLWRKFHPEGAQRLVVPRNRPLLFCSSGARVQCGPHPDLGSA